MMPAEGMGEATVGDKINLVIDLDRCWGCKACEVACKQELELGAGPRPMLVEAIGPRQIEDQLHWDFVPVLCLSLIHISEPTRQLASSRMPSSA